jgi:MoaA/NifB/PqqE/SkfB family radical SAM enzyme
VSAGAGPFAPPAVDPTAAIGTTLHDDMLRVAFPQGGRGLAAWRPRGLDPFHRFKLAFLIRQPHFVLRLLNYAVYRAERRRFATVHYAPPAVQVETNGSCNLRCPGCVTGLLLPAGGRKRKARLDDLTSLVDRIHRRTFQLSFHRQGEPLLSEHFYPAAAYATAKGLWTVAHSNLSLDTEDLAGRILASKLCNLVVSCDGATQETYEKYRRRGRVDLVFDNIRGIDDAKRRSGARFPWVTAKFVVFDHNWHELKLYRERALAAGANDVLFVVGFSGSIYATGEAATESEFDLHTLRWKKRDLEPLCAEIWDSMGVDHDGGVLPCCYAYTDDHLFAAPDDAAGSSILERWNSPKYRQMRAFFAARAPRDLAGLPSPCRTCEYSRAKLASLV